MIDFTNKNMCMMVIWKASDKVSFYHTDYFIPAETEVPALESCPMESIVIHKTNTPERESINFMARLYERGCTLVTFCDVNPKDFAPYDVATARRVEEK